VPNHPSKAPTLIRPAVAADAPALGELGAALVAQHHAYDPQRFIAPTPRSAAGYGHFLAGELAKPEVRVLVAEAADGTVAGYAYGALEGMDWMALRGPAGAIYDLVVSPEHRGGGLGRRLVLALLAELESLGAPRVVLSTAEPNQAAQRLFESLGFRFTLREMTREAGDGA
jgi:ribosomal protein S18 acetylase RimI-like enzyme